MKQVNIEIDPSGRVNCEGCGKHIPKGELRMKEVVRPHGEEPSDFEIAHFYHLPHAAEKKPREIREALSEFKAELPNRAHLMSVATKLIKEFDSFAKNAKWHNNDRGNRVISGDEWTITVFKKGEDWNWVLDGNPISIFASLIGEQPQKAPVPSKERPKSQFGPGFFATQSDAIDDLWLFLRERSAGTGP